MDCRIRLKKSIESDIFGQWKGEYLGENTEIYAAGTYGGMIKCSLIKGDIVTVCIKPVKSVPTVQEFDCVCIASIYALNPSMGVVLTVTKVL
jgi:hypothetical protein